MANQSTLREQPKTDRFSQLFDQFYERFLARVQALQNRSPLSKQTNQIIATLALSLTIIAGGYGGYKVYTARQKEADLGKRLVRRNSGVKRKDGARTLYVPYKDKASRVTIHPTKTTTFDAHRRLFLQPFKDRNAKGSEYGAPPPNIKPGLNIAFLHQFMSIMKIAIPRLGCKESGLLATHAVFLLLRTYLSLVTARLDGEIVRDLVAGNGRAFLLGLTKWLSVL
jgi:ATP-binding cassette subfamily D (ALD) long-chain fatty acid import protein